MAAIDALCDDNLRSFIVVGMVIPSVKVDKVCPYLIFGRASNVHNQVALHDAFHPEKPTSLVPLGAVALPVEQPPA